MVKNICTSLYDAINDPPKNSLFLDIDTAQNLLEFSAIITNSQVSIFLIIVCLILLVFNCYCTVSGSTY